MYTAFCFIFIILMIVEITAIICHYECEDFDCGGIVAVVCLVVQFVLGIVALFHVKLMFWMSVCIVILCAPLFIFMYSKKANKWLENVVGNSNRGREREGCKFFAKLAKQKKGILLVLAIVAFLCLCGWVFDRSNTLVKQGERGVKTVWGKVVPKSYEPGLVRYWPFTEKYGNKVFKVPIRPQRYRYSIPVRTKELQSVTLDCAVLLQLTPDSVHVLYDKYTGYLDYEKNVVQDLVQSTMLTITSQLSFWSFAEEINSMVSEAVEYIVNDQLMLQNLAKIEAFRLKGYQASAEIEALIDQTAQARQGVELETWKLEKAKVETERVKQEALQTYERLAAVAKANGIDVQIKAESLKNNPFVAQYEVAKALQNWNGSMNLPNTLMTMSSAANGGASPSILPIVPITTR